MNTIVEKITELIKEMLQGWVMSNLEGDASYLYVNNPYGYYEAVSYEDFIARTTFSAFEKMPLGYSFGFAFGLFSKNTIIVPEGV